MATQLKNIVSYVGILPGAFATQAHGLNIRGLGVIPDEVKLSNGDFIYITATTANLTIRNQGAVAANCDVLVEHWHTIERTFGPDSVISLTPQPFVGAGSGGGGGGTDRYAPPEKWVQQNVAAGQVGVELYGLMSTSFDRIKMIRAGSIIGISTRLTQPITDANPNSLVATVTINGAPGALSLSHSAGVNPDGGEATQAPGGDVFAAGDELGIKIWTLGTFLPNTTDIEAWIDLEF